MQIRNGWPVEPSSCPCCTICWRYMDGPNEGRCIYQGPYLGYVNVEEVEQKKEIGASGNGQATVAQPS